MKRYGWIMSCVLLLSLGTVTGCSQANGSSIGSPTILQNIKVNEIQHVSIDGWGAGADGNRITFLYNPFGSAKAVALLDALKHGKAVSSNHLAHDDATGGENWLVLHLANGRSLKVEWASHTDVAGEGPAPNTFWVSETNPSIGAFITDNTGISAKLYMQLFQAASSTATRQPAWLSNAVQQGVSGMVVDGNNDDTWFQDDSLPATAPTSATILSAIGSMPVIGIQSIDLSKMYGPLSQWRTHSSSLKLELKDGATIHVSGPYSLLGIKSSEAGVSAFKVTYANANSQTAVFIEDSTGQLKKYWDELGISE